MRSCIYVVRNPLALIIKLVWHLPTFELVPGLDGLVYPHVKYFVCHKNGHRLVQGPECKQTADLSF